MDGAQRSSVMRRRDEANETGRGDDDAAGVLMRRSEHVGYDAA